MKDLAKIIAKAITMQKTSTEDTIYKYLKSQLNSVSVKVYREDKEVPLPIYGKNGDACMDVYCSSVEDKDDGRTVYHTGLHFELPDNYEMEIRPRSSNTKTWAVMQNSPGTLDAGYRGELLVVHRNMKYPYKSTAAYKVGDRIAQILVRRREKIVFEEVDNLEELSNTERGDGGFGSTGK